LFDAAPVFVALLGSWIMQAPEKPSLYAPNTDAAAA
jgi:hypothetical protein